jgi:hypothetical protein
MQLWNEPRDEQEMTFYRRFASYLDTLLVKTDLKMIEYVHRTKVDISLIISLVISVVAKDYRYTSNKIVERLECVMFISM